MKNSIKRLISIILAVSFVLSLCFISSITTSAAEHSYYVKNGKSGNGLSPTSPMGKVADVLDAISSLPASDTVNIYIMQRDDFESSSSFNVTYWDTYAGSSTFNVHAHSAKIIVQPYDPETTTYLALSSTNAKANTQHMTLGGPTEFRNITLLSSSGYNSGISAHGKNLTLGEGVKFAGFNSSTWDGSILTLYALQITGAKFRNDGTYTESQTITIENDTYTTGTQSNMANRAIYPFGKAQTTQTFNQDLTIIINNSAAAVAPAIYWGCNTGKGATVKGNFNIYVKNAGSITNTDNAGTVTIEGGLQYIVKAGITVNNPDPTTFTGVTAGSKWLITDNTGVDDVISFTSTAGTYNVKSGYEVTATNDSTGVETVSSEGVLTLAAGSYTITAQAEIVKVYDYYVQSGGTGDGTSDTTPAATVADVIPAVNASLGAGETANVYIMRGPDRDTTGVGELVGGSDRLTPSHGFTAWSTDETIPSHTAKIIVQSYNYDDENATYLAYCDKVGANKDMVLGGPTEFDNITLLSTRKTDRYIEQNGNDVTYRSGVKYAYINRSYSDATATAWNGAVVDCSALGTFIGNTSSTQAYTNDVNVVFENAFSSTNANTTLYIDVRSNKNNSYAGDINITFNNASASPRIQFGANEATLNVGGDINVNVQNANGATLVAGNQSVNVTGGVQVFVNKNMTVTGGLSSFSNITAAGKWLVKVNESDVVTPTSTLGQFTVANDNVAVATDDNDAENVVISSAGVLDLTGNSGDYTVEIVDEYTNNGSTITVYGNGVEIDLSTVKHNYIANKLFVGWQKANGTYAEETETYSAGDTLTAQYEDYDSDAFVVEEAQMRTEGDLGIRFIIKEDKDFRALFPNIIEFGAIALPTDVAGGREIFLNEGVVITWTWDENNINDFSPATVGSDIPASVIAGNILEESPTDIRYTACITGDDIDEEYDTFYLVKGYIKYEDNNGIVSVFHTEDAQTSLYKLAAEAVAAGEESDLYDRIISYVKTARTDYKNAVEGRWELRSDYSDTTKFPEGSEGYKYRNNKFYYDATTKMRVREVTVNTGMGIEPMELGWISDSHLNYVNQKDVNEVSVNSLSTYRGRTWNRGSSPVNNLNTVMKYAAAFVKTVVTGDQVDYLSWGSLELTQNLIARKSVNNSVLMTTGNHEYAEFTQADLGGLEELYTADQQRDLLLQPVWSNDVRYHEEIVKTDSGENNVMLVLLDNGFDSAKYASGSATKLAASIAKARTLNIPILLFQHVPMLTMNPTETDIYEGPDQGLYLATEAEHPTKVVKYDMTTKSKYIGPNSSDAEARAVFDLIRKSSDVIKGVFDGHEHVSLYTEIVATDENGDDISDGNGYYEVIPQFTMTSSSFGSGGFVGKIILQ